MSTRSRVLRHESALAAWELVTREPAVELLPYVRGYQGYVETSAGAPVLRQQVPTTQLPLIVNFGAPWTVAEAADGSGRIELRDSFFAGPFDSSAFVAATGPAKCVQIDLSPIGAHMLLGVPMDDLVNRVVDLDELMPRQLRRLAEQLADAPSWDAGFERLDDMLATRLREARKPPAEVVWAWDELVRTHGRIPVGRLAQSLGRSRRHVVARFREHIGLPPKTVARILRFNRAVGLLQRAEAPGLAELAFACGYYDQAHLNRDFREFAGLSPGEFARRIVPDGGVPA